MNKAQLAHAFASGQSKGSCHNARIDADTYYLHGSAIARVDRVNMVVTGNWCGYYTATTASHLNAIIKALRQQSSLVVSDNVSYAQARNTNTTELTLATIKP